MGEWDKRPSVEKHVIGAHSYSGIPFGPLWLQCLSQVLFVCMPVTKSVSVCVCVCVSVWVCVAEHVQVFLCSYLCDSLRAESEAEWGIRIRKTSLGTSGCDWQEKKGSLCSGNWQREPDQTQYNPALPSTVQNRPTLGEKKHQQQGCSPSSLPTYPDSWPILIIPQQSPWLCFFFLS